MKQKSCPAQKANILAENSETPCRTASDGMPEEPSRLPWLEGDHEKRKSPLARSDRPALCGAGIDVCSHKCTDRILRENNPKRQNFSQPL